MIGCAGHPTNMLKGNSKALRELHRLCRHSQAISFGTDNAEVWMKGRFLVEQFLWRKKKKNRHATVRIGLLIQKSRPSSNIHGVSRSFETVNVKSEKMKQKPRTRSIPIEQASPPHRAALYAFREPLGFRTDVGCLCGDRWGSVRTTERTKALYNFSPWVGRLFEFRIWFHSLTLLGAGGKRDLSTRCYRASKYS
jgi:hypothetical protein